jgi:putative flippase GtrA
MFPVLDPIVKGIANALLTVAAASLGVYFFFSTVPLASPELLRSLASIGATLVLAYVVEAVWLVQRSQEDEEYEEWLGMTIGAAIAGFLGIALALLLAEHRAAGHANFVDELGAAWVAVSLFILGASLVAHPLLAYRLRDLGEGQRVDDGSPGPGRL